MSPLSVIILLAAATSQSLPGALASHFRGGWIEYAVEGDGRTVNYRVITSWKASFLGSVSFQYGDGRTKRLRFSSYSSNAEMTLLYADSDYKTVVAEFKYVYSGGSDSTSSFYTVGFSSGNRVGSLVNSANSRFSLYSGFQMAPGLKSPTVSVPAILQVPTNAVNGIPMIAIAPPSTGPNPDCAVTASSSDSGIRETPSIPTGGQVTMLPSPCTLQWDTTGARENDLYAYQYRYQAPGNPNYMSVDFVMKIVTDPPTCIFSDGSSGQYVVAMGGTLSFDVDVDEVNGLDVELSTLPSPLRLGMTANPSVGQGVSVPAKYTFTFTPQPGDQGLSYPLNMFFTSQRGIKCMIAPSISVRESSPPPPSPPPSPPPQRSASPPRLSATMISSAVSCCALPCCMLTSSHMASTPLFPQPLSAPSAPSTPSAAVSASAAAPAAPKVRH